MRLAGYCGKILPRLRKASLTADRSLRKQKPTVPNENSVWRAGGHAYVLPGTCFVFPSWSSSSRKFTRIARARRLASRITRLRAVFTAFGSSSIKASRTRRNGIPRRSSSGRRRLTATIRTATIHQTTKIAMRRIESFRPSHWCD